jgi:hypothetical protein
VFKQLSGTLGGDCVPRNVPENHDIGAPTWDNTEKRKQHDFRNALAGNIVGPSIAAITFGNAFDVLPKLYINTFL